MHTLVANVSFLHVAALQQAIVASLGAKFIGVNAGLTSSNVPVTWTPGNPPVQNNGTTFLHMDDSALPADDTTAQNVATAHDPVFLTANRTSIPADGATAITVSVSAPKAGAAAVTLIVTKPDGSTVTQAVTMTVGAGSVAITVALSGTYTVSVQNPSNRTTDTITFQGV